MKFGQLIESYMRNIFLEKSYTKCGAEASARPFYKKYISGSTVWKILKFVFAVCPSPREKCPPENYLTEINPPGKLPPRRFTPRKIAPQPP